MIATGGLAPLLAEGTTRVIERIDPDLTLDGLRLLSLRNSAAAFAARPCAVYRE